MPRKGPETTRTTPAVLPARTEPLSASQPLRLKKPDPRCEVGLILARQEQCPVIVLGELLVRELGALLHPSREVVDTPDHAAVVGFVDLEVVAAIVFGDEPEQVLDDAGDLLRREGL